MAGRRVAGGTLVLDGEGLSKLAVGDARVRGYRPFDQTIVSV